MVGIAKRALSERIKGKRSSSVRALLAAATAGAVAAGITYRVLRS